jgi:SAM-dependent methyltransferase
MKSDIKTDTEKWNEKYASRPGALGSPDRFLSDNLSYLAKGTVLDVACGNGRNSIFLASSGFSVMGVDISQVALAQLDQFSNAKKLSVTTKRIDLEHGETDFSATFKPYGNIVIINYKPGDLLWKALPTLLVTGGVLVYCTFNTKHHEKHGFPERFCIEPGLYKTPPPSLSLLSFEEREETAQSRDGYIFQKA